MHRPLFPSVNNGINPEMIFLSYIKMEEVTSKVAQLGKGPLLAKYNIDEA